MTAIATPPRTGVVDVSHLSDRNDTLQAPVYLGVVGLVVVESTVFATLISSYFYLYGISLEWPPGEKPPKLILPTINTVVLLTSTMFIYIADKAARVGNKARLIGGLVTGTLFAVAFLVIKAIEYSKIEYRWDDHAYASIVWTISGFHATHVIALVLKTVIVLVLSVRDVFTPQNSVGVQTNGLYWYFVAIVWLPLYVVLYIMPRVLE